MPQFIFIYNNLGVSNYSRDDLQSLFTNHDLYSAPNVQLSDFNCNLDGLSPEQITFVIPGGSAPAMGPKLHLHKEKLQSLLSEGAQGLFICAGALLAAGSADLFYDSYKKQPDSPSFAPLNYWCNTTEFDLTNNQYGIQLDILSEYRALGTFIPNDTYLPYSQALLNKMRYKPYLTHLTFNTTQRRTKELFIAGCGFEALTEQTDSVATYSDKDHYSFFYPGKHTAKTLSNMAAIVKKPGIIASGVHLEACVENSKLLKLMTEGLTDRGHSVLPLTEDTAYIPASSSESIIPLLKDTLNPSCR